MGNLRAERLCSRGNLTQVRIGLLWAQSRRSMGCVFPEKFSSCIDWCCQKVSECFLQWSSFSLIEGGTRHPSTPEFLNWRFGMICLRRLCIARNHLSRHRVKWYLCSYFYKMCPPNLPLCLGKIGSGALWMCQYRCSILDPYHERTRW